MKPWSAILPRPLLLALLAILPLVMLGLKTERPAGFSDPGYLEMLAANPLQVADPLLVIYFDSLVSKSLALEPRTGFQHFEVMGMICKKRGFERLYLESQWNMGACLLRLGQRAEGKKLIRSSIRQYVQLTSLPRDFDPLFRFIYVTYTYQKEPELMLEILLEMAKEGPSKFGNRIYELSFRIGYLYYFFQDYEQAAPYFQLVLDHESLMEDKNNISSALCFTGWIYRYKGDYKKAIHYFREFEESCKKYGPKASELEARKFRANIYELQGQFHLALDNYLKVLEEERPLANGDKVDYAWTLNAIGSIYRKQGEVAAAKRYLNEALRIYEEWEITHGMASCNRDLGYLYLELGKYDSALLFLKKNLNLRIEDSGSGYGEALVAVAKVYHLTNQNSLAFEYLGKAVKDGRKTGNVRYLNAGYILMAGILLEDPSLKSHPVLANYGLKGVDDLIVKIRELRGVDESSENRLNGLKILNRYFEQKGNIAKAYQYHLAFTSFKDSLYDRKHLMALKDLESKVELGKKQQQIQLLEHEHKLQVVEIDRQKELKEKAQLQWVGILLILAGGAYLWFVRYQTGQKRRAQKRHLELEKREELEQMKTRFFANMTHEFKTPLTLIEAPIANLLNKANSRLDKELLQIVRRNGLRLKRLANQMLEVNLIQEGEVQFHQREINLSRLIRAVYGDFIPYAEDKGIDFKLALPAFTVKAMLDWEKIEEVLFNLASNAIKFTPRGKAVKISLQTDDSGLYLVVADEGSGISAEAQQHIFERFYRGDENAGNAGQSTGLGLSICREYVQLHGGTIQLESKVGVGTVFTVALPVHYHLVKEPVQISNTFPKIETINIGRKVVEPDVTLLLVEDNLDLRFFISQTVLADYFLILASDGREGMELAREHQPDIIISDIMMPDMDGHQLLDELNADERTDHIPFIFLTAKTLPTDRLAGLRRGADAYIEKPFKPEELQYYVRNLLNRQAQMREQYRYEMVSLTEGINEEAPFLKKVKGLVIENIDNPQFGVTQLGKEIGLSRSQLHRKLKSLSSFSPNQFIRNIRLKAALEMLKSSDLSISEIAYRTGFTSPSYFTKCFKETYEFAPSDIAKTAS